MKKKILLIINIILFSKFTYSSSLEIEDFLNKLETKSTFKKIDKLERKKLTFEKKEAIKLPWRKIDLNSNINYYQYGSSNNDYNHFDGSYAQIDYNMFFLSGTSENNYSYNYQNNSGTNLSTFNIGIKKDLYDFYYNPNDYKVNIATHKISRYQIVSKKNLYKKKEELISLYSEIVELQYKEFMYSIEIKKNNQLLNRYKIRKDFSSKFKIRDYQLKISNLEREQKLTNDKKTLKLKLLCANSSYNFKDGMMLTPFKVENLTTIKGQEFDLKILLEDKKLIEEEIRYLKRERMGNLRYSTSYDTKNNDWKLELRIKNVFFDDRTKINNRIKDLEKLKLQKQDKLAKLKLQKEDIKNRLISLKEKMNFSEEQLILQNERYSAANDLYEKGLFEFEKFVSIRYEYELSQIKYNINTNKYNTLKYKIMLLNKY